MFNIPTYRMNCEQLQVVSDAIMSKLDIVDVDDTTNDEYTEIVTLQYICNAGITCCETLSKNSDKEVRYDMPITDLLFRVISVHKDMFMDNIPDECDWGVVSKLIVLVDLVARLDN